MAIKSDIKLVVERYFPGAQLNVVKRLTGGVSADVYRLDLLFSNGSESSVVLRCHGSSHSGHVAMLEFELLKSLFTTGLPVPEPFLVDTSCAILAYPFLLIAFIDGRSFPTEATVETYINTMAESLSTVHKTAPNPMLALPFRLDPLPKALDFLPTGPSWFDLRNYLVQMENTEYLRAPVLLHGDFWPANLIWSEAGIVTILDWEDAALGDPLADVASTCLELRYIYGKKGMLQFTKAFEKQGPVESKRLALWLVYVAASAQKYMSNWGLEPSREIHMRQTAMKTINEMGAVLMANEH